MALKIIPASEPIPTTQLTVVLYAPPGLGKTSTAFTSSKAILFDFDNGARRSEFRKDTILAKKWSDISDFDPDQLEEFDTVVIDTAGRALDALTEEIIRDNFNLKQKDGALTLKGYGALSRTFLIWLNRIHSMGKDVILLAHSEEQKKGEDIIERIDVQGRSKNEIYKSADLMGRILHGGKYGHGRLDFSPRENGYGKNPTGLPVIDIPNYKNEPNFFAGIIDSVKNDLNKASESAIKEQEEINGYRDKFNSLETAEEFNDAVSELKEAKPLIKGLLVASAKSKDIIFDKATKTFQKKV